jgi:serine/threonine protein kinase
MDGQYKITSHIIGKGSFGIVKLGLDQANKKLVAIKTETKGKNKSLLTHEYNIIKSCSQSCGRSGGTGGGGTGGSGGTGIIQSRHFWEDKDNYYLVLDLMGPSLDSLHKLCSRSFSLRTTLALATQMLDLIHFYHKHDIVHRDIKPSNFLMNYSVPHTYVALIDFGLAKRYRVNGKHIPFATGSPQVGSLRYMSKHVHSSIEPSCRDDLYSLGYCIIFMFTGLLPWQNATITKMEKAERKQYVAKLKRETSNNDLVRNCKCLECIRAGPARPACCFSGVMLDYFNYLDQLEYDTIIDYDHIRAMFEMCKTKHGLQTQTQTQTGDGFAWDWQKYYIISSASTGI